MESVWHWLLGVAFSDAVLMTVLVVPLLLLVERWRPARAAPRGHLLFGLRYWLVNLLLLTAIAPLLNLAAAVGVQQFGVGLLDLSVIGLDGIGGALLALMVSTFVLDFFYYWFHRLMHASPMLWQIHLLHHSDEHMGVMTAQRHHFAEALLVPLFVTVPMAILFKLPPVTIAVLAVLPQAYQYLAHANIRLGYGPFWWLLLSPDVHRIHHSIEARHHDRNFANWFPVWDVIFGTLYLPKPDERPATGVDGVEVKTVRAALLLPFAGWWAMVRPAPASKRR